MFRKEFMSTEGPTWATVTWYKGWGELDEDTDGPSWQESFKSVHGEDSWSQFQEDFDNAIVSRQDQWQVLMTDLMASSED